MKLCSLPFAWIACLITLFCFCSHLALAQGVGQGVEDWPVADPDTMDLDLATLEEHLDLCKRSLADGCLVAHKGYIVQEWYHPDYDGSPINIASATKSLVGLLTAMLVADGEIQSIDEPVSNYIPEWEAGAEAGVTIRHLLTMTAGLDQRRGCRGPRKSVACPEGMEDLNAFALKLPLDGEPGEEWSYSNESSQLLSPILERAAGMPLWKYAQERLFEPLGMDSTKFFVDKAGNTATLGGVETTLRDLAKIGQLMLNEGRWSGQQIIPARWVHELTQPISLMNYGLQWWVHEPTGSFAALGSKDNVLQVIPDLDLVVARVQTYKEGAGVQYQSLETIELIRSIVERER